MKAATDEVVALLTCNGGCPSSAFLCRICGVISLEKINSVISGPEVALRVPESIDQLKRLASDCLLHIIQTSQAEFEVKYRSALHALSHSQAVIFCWDLVKRGDQLEENAYICARYMLFMHTPSCFVFMTLYPTLFFYTADCPSICVVALEKHLYDIFGVQSTREKQEARVSSQQGSTVFRGVPTLILKDLLFRDELERGLGRWHALVLPWLRLLCLPMGLNLRNLIVCGF